MTIIEILNYLNKSIKAGIAGGVESLKGHTFKVEHPQVQNIYGKVKVDFPQVQKIVGTVDVKFPENQKISGQVKTDVKEDIIKLIERLNETKSILEEKGVKVKNFPIIPSEIKVSNFPKEVLPDFSSLEKKLDLLNESISKLPKKFPDFPKLPDYPIQKPTSFPKSFVVDNLEALKSEDPKSYVPVRLTDGKEFYKAIEEFYQSVTSNVTFALASGQKSFGLVDEDKHLQVDVLSSIAENPSLVLGYTGTDLTTITKTIGTTQYQQTLTYTGGVLQTVSEWIKI